MKPDAVADSTTYLQHVLGLLKGLLGEEPLPLDLDVQRLRNIRYHEVNQATHSENDMLKKMQL